MVTRRTVLRHYLLRPDAKVNQLTLYALAVASNRFNVSPHDIVMLSTHVHCQLTDNEGNLPSFIHCFHRTVALGIKVLRKWDGQVWDSRESSVVHLNTETAIIENSAYIQANPTEAGAAKDPARWPGVRLSASHDGEVSIRVRRPDFYFSTANPDWPEEATLNLTLPPALVKAVGSKAEAVQKIHTEFKNQQENALQKAAAQKWKFPAPHRAKMVSHLQRATSFEPFRDRNPTFATGRGRKERFLASVQNLKTFRHDYREALALWRSGIRDVLFPWGTWQMHVLHGALVAPGPAG